MKYAVHWTTTKELVTRKKCDTSKPYA